MCLKSASKTTIPVLGRKGCFTVEVGGVCVVNRRVKRQFLYWYGGDVYRGSGWSCVLNQRVNQQSMYWDGLVVLPWKWAGSVSQISE